MSENLKQIVAERLRNFIILSIYYTLKAVEAVRHWYFSIPEEQRLAGIVLGTVFLGGFLSGFLSGRWYYTGPQVPQSILPPEAVAVYQLPRLTAPLNILVLGSGSEAGKSPYPILRRGEAVADLIWVVNLHPPLRRINLLSVPSDTLVEIPEHGFAKLKYAPQAGGIPLTKTLVEKMTGLTMDRTVRLDMRAAEQLVEWLGGLDLYVEQNFQYVDRTGRTNINLRKGWQPLNGRQVVDYLRFRFDSLGEIGRIRRQQRLVHLVLQKLLQPSALGKLPALMALGHKLVETDLNGKEVTRITGLLGTLTAQDVNMAILPGNFGSAGNWSSSYSLWLPDRGQIQQLVGRLWGTDPGHQLLKGQTVSVLTALQDRRINDTVVQRLVEQGFRVTRLFHVKANTFPATQIIDRTLGTSPAALTGLRQVLPQARLTFGDDGAYELQTDYAVVLGLDFAPAALNRQPVPLARVGAEAGLR